MYYGMINRQQMAFSTAKEDLTQLLCRLVPLVKLWYQPQCMEPPAPYFSIAENIKDFSKFKNFETIQQNKKKKSTKRSTC